MLADQLLPYVRTEEEAYWISEALATAAQVLGGKRSGEVTKVLAEHLGKELAEEVLGYRDDEGEDRVTQLKSASQAIAVLPVVALTVAVRPTERLVNRVIAWLRQHVGMHVVVRLHYSQPILGGATVEWQGRYVDVSLRKKLSQYIEEKKLAEWMRL